MTKEEQTRIEKVFFDRMVMLDIKHTTQKYYLVQQEFFIGVMTALNISPPYWTICIMSSRDIVESLRKNK